MVNIEDVQLVQAFLEDLESVGYAPGLSTALPLRRGDKTALCLTGQGRGELRSTADIVLLNMASRGAPLTDIFVVAPPPVTGKEGDVLNRIALRKIVLTDAPLSHMRKLFER